MSRAHHHYPVASTSYHQPPSDIGSRRPRQPAPTLSHPDFSRDIYIPESQEELNRVSIESRLLQASGPKHNPGMRRGDFTAASSTFDTYDRIGREEDFAATRPPVSSTAARQTRSSNIHASSHRQIEVEEDESLIPGVGRGVRSTMPSQTSYQERIRSLNHHAAQHPFRSSPAKSPYRPGKYSSGYLAPGQAKQPAPASSSLRPSATTHTRPSTALPPRQPHVESESESDGDSVTDSDGMNVHTATFNSTGNHRNFAATPVAHTATMTANFRQRPTLGQDTLDRIEFDVHTDTDAEQRPRQDTQSTRAAAAAAQHHRPRPDPSGPFASPRATTNTFGMNAADYQQHLASRTLTSPALRTLIGDRSKSPDSPTPAPSIDGVLHAGKTNSGKDSQQRHQQPCATRQDSISAVSAFEDLARRLQRDVEVTRRGRDAAGEEGDDGSASNSGGSGFGPGSQASSARTRVEPESHPGNNKVNKPSHFNAHGFPAHQKTAAAHDTTSPWGVRLPDVTGLTSALGSPVKARDAVKHRPFDSAVGNQDARLEELVNLRCFVDGIQVELDRAGERILNLEQAQEQQSHEFQGLRSEMQSALKDVKASQPRVEEDQLLQLMLQKLQSGTSSQQQTERTSESPQVQTQAPKPVAQSQASKSHAPRQRGESRSQVEVVNRLYTELDKLRMVMEEQYRSAAGIPRESNEREEVVETRPQHATYRHQDNIPTGRDPWDATEALRLQVLSLAEEVEGLNGLVLEHLTQPAPTASRKRQARTSNSSARHNHYYDDAHPASEPIQPAPARSYRRDHTDIRTDPIDDADDHQHYHHHRRVSFGRHRDQSEEEYDATIDAIAENVRIQRERQRRRHRPAPVEVHDDEDEISQLADARAARASARAGSHYQSTSHNSATCTVCTASTRSDKRKASRRARLLAAEERRQAVELEESILLDALDPQTPHSPSTKPARIGAEELETLKVILREHWDEFLHQRMLYSELADELKTMSPGMGKAKRRILAEHVLEAVEMLELKADRIERLEKVISSCSTGNVGSREKEDGVVRKEAGSRVSSGTGTSVGAGGNRLKHALESFERRSRGGSSPPRVREAEGRNSPPTTLQL
ncbi:hypothetical protein NDA13_004207 [Ustilago tritici]|nr:hypothetical protein NDA13_004207 [Ustilago tritici]